MGAAYRYGACSADTRVSLKSYHMMCSSLARRPGVMLGVVGHSTRALSYERCIDWVEVGGDVLIYMMMNHGQEVHSIANIHSYQEDGVTKLWPRHKEEGQQSLFKT